MIETLEGVHNLSQILTLEGVTGVMVGPYDLALSIGCIKPEAIMSQVVFGIIKGDRFRSLVGPLYLLIMIILGGSGCGSPRSLWSKRPL
jgi:citrate lyase beta subunit